MSRRKTTAPHPPVGERWSLNRQGREAAVFILRFWGVVFVVIVIGIFILGFVIGQWIH